jgi:biopolymer transport protein ExbD
VVVQPDGKIPLQALVDVLDHLTAMGVVKLSLSQR